MNIHWHAQGATKQLEEEAAALAEQRSLREANMNPDRPDEAALRKLDASVKRNTVLTKKLRAVTEESKTGLLEEIQRTNQAKVSCAGSNTARLSFRTRCMRGAQPCAYTGKC